MSAIVCLDGIGYGSYVHLLFLFDQAGELGGSTDAWDR